jgi:Domain of unknown function (DUF3943)
MGLSVYARKGLLATVVLVVLATSQMTFAQQATPDLTPAPDVAPAPAQDPPLQTDATRNYGVPLADIVIFDSLLNRYAERFVDHGTYNVSLSSVRRNLRSHWVLDNDPFSVNQFMHPYQGSVYFGSARSAGLNYWESLGYTFAGSALWEIAGETSKPSRNDQIATGIGGSLLGEPLFRMASLVLEQSNDLPRFWRELSAAVLSPATGFNRAVYGDRFRAVFPSRDPSFFTRVQLGAMGTASVQKSLTQPLSRNEGVVDFSIDYGLPGTPGYAYTRPFDYFSLQFTASSANHFENIFSRGLLKGRNYGEGTDAHRGVWGLFGTYDYVSPQIFRVSSSALSLGTTAQRRLIKSGVIQMTMLAGLGYGAAGTVNGADAKARDYHYGLTPQLLVAGRLISKDKVAFDLTLRDYYVSSVASTEHRGSENIARGEALFSYRFQKHQAASVRYVWSRRAASYPDAGEIVVQSRGSFGFFYTYFGGTRFGAVTW